MPVFGDPPVTVPDKEFNKCVSQIKEAVKQCGGSATVNSLLNNKAKLNAEVKELAELFLVGKMTGRLDAFHSFARKLKDTFEIETPATGALWGGDGAQDQAKVALGSSGKVLSETQLGSTAVKMRLPPQGPKKGESASEFSVRNETALKFWGAISALYAENLTGDIHVWMPRGLTVGSIFWNDELPVLMERKRKGESFNLIFHTNPGKWSETVRLEDLVISGAYIADRKGLYVGRQQLKDEVDPPKGLNANDDLKTSMTLTLSNPIKVATVRFAMEALLRYNTIKKKNAGKPSEEQLSPAVLARLAAWQTRARLELGKKIDAKSRSKAKLVGAMGELRLDYRVKGAHWIML